MAASPQGNCKQYRANCHSPNLNFALFFSLETPCRTRPDRGRWQGQGWLVQHLWEEGPVPLEPLPRFHPGAGRRRKPLWHQRLWIRQAEKPQALLHRSSLHLPGEGQQDQVYHLHWQSSAAQGGEDAWWVVRFQTVVVSSVCERMMRG